MEAGRLRHRVTIKYKVVSRDTYGAEVITWTTLATVWAQIEPLAGREFLEARQTQAELTTKITMRYRDGIEPEMQAVWGSITYDILSVVHLETRERTIQLMCKEQL